MKLSEIKHHLLNAETVNFQLENGKFVPEHFHVTEVGVTTKNFIDCGGQVRSERKVNFQLWDANDFDHRLKPEKLSKIIALAERVLAIEDLAIEVEYQSETIGKYNLEYDGKNFILQSTQTDCLAPENCGVPALEASCCGPNSNCC